MNKYNVPLDELGARIRDIRVNIAKMTMDEFADKIKKTSKGKVSPGKSNVSRWERGKNLPNDLALKSISEFSGISVDELLYGTLKDYSYNVVVDEINKSGDFFKLFVKHLLKSDASPFKGEKEAIAKETVLSFIRDNFDEIYDVMLTRQRMASANLLMNNPEDQKEYYIKLAKEKLIAYGKEDNVLLYAKMALRKLLPFDPSYKESSETVMNKLNEIGGYRTHLAFVELYEENLKDDIDDEEAKIKAFNQFYRSKLFTKVNDLRKDIKSLDEEVQSKQKELGIKEDN